MVASPHARAGASPSLSLQAGHAREHPLRQLDQIARRVHQGVLVQIEVPRLSREFETAFEESGGDRGTAIPSTLVGARQLRADRCSRHRTSAGWRVHR